MIWQVIEILCNEKQNPIHNATRKLAISGVMVYEFRITKYDPAHRNQHGAYMRDEWTAVVDIGRKFSGVVLTSVEYERVETAYVTAAVEFMHECGVSALFVVGLENYAGIKLQFDEGASLNLIQVGEVVRQVLRGDYWCRLEAGEAFVHIGYDYYMYIRVPMNCPNALAHVQQLGLFPETFCSPYHEQNRRTKSQT